VPSRRSHARERGSWSPAPRHTCRLFARRNLASVERGRFAAGDQLPVFEVGCGTIALQICREVRFPETVARACGSRRSSLPSPRQRRGPRWFVRRLAIAAVARAHETERFVVSANAAHRDQHAPSLVVAPTRQVIDELPRGIRAIRRYELDLSEIANTYLSQRRRDLAGGMPAAAR
jgi:predicted amidohydrolase